MKNYVVLGTQNFACPKEVTRGAFIRIGTKFFSVLLRTRMLTVLKRIK